MTRARTGGFTLLEMMVAVTMLALITSAASLAISVAIRQHAQARALLSELEEERAVLWTMVRDIKHAHVSQDNPDSIFLASGSQTGAVLTLTTRAARLEPGDLAPSGETMGGEVAEPRPQSDVALVQYVLDPEARTLSRSASTTPGAADLPLPGGPTTIVSRNVSAVEFEFIDEDQSVRMDWAYAASPETALGVAVDTAQSDQSLPRAVRLRLTLVGPERRATVLTTTVAPVTPDPAPQGQAPPQQTGAQGGTGTQGGAGGGARL